MDLQYAVEYEFEGVVSVHGFSESYRRIDSELSDDSLKRLVNLVMQTEALIFCADTRTSPDTIVNAIFLKKNLIEDRVVDTIEKGIDNRLYNNMYSNIMDKITEHSFRQQVISMKF
jgi:hypothetical protein